MTNATALLGMPPPGVWVLLDFTRDASPLRLKAAEYSFELFRSDGSPKPAAAAVRAGFAASGRVDPGFDGGFEEPGVGTWRHHGAGSFARDTSVARSGAASAALAGPTGGRALLTTIPTVPWVRPGQRVTLSPWAQGAAATGTTYVELQWLAADRRHLGAIDSAQVPHGTTGWTLLTASGTAPPGAAFVRIALVAAANTGTSRFDDVSLSDAGTE